MFVYFFLVNNLSVVAQETTISASPAIIDLAVSPGEESTNFITIRNGGDFGLPISLEVQSLQYDDEKLLPNNNKYDASDWLVVEDKAFLLGAKETKKIPVTAKIPIDASAGGHYVQIAIRGLSLENENSSASIVVPEISVTVLISVAGEVINDISVDGSNILPLIATPKSTIMSNFYVLNKGNIHDLVTPIVVISKNGSEISRQQLTPRIILPDTKKLFNEEIKIPKEYGVYSSTIEIRYANGEQTFTTSPEIILVSRPISSILLIGTITIFGLYLYNHRKNIQKSVNILLGPDT